LPHPGKVLFFAVLDKAVASPTQFSALPPRLATALVLESLNNIWEVSRTSPGQNSEAIYPVSRKRRLEDITTGTI